MNPLYVVSLVILMVSCISGFVIQQIFLSRLRKIHMRTWEQLGKPVIFLNSGMLNTLDFLRFMWRREYESLGDPRTIALGRFLRGFLLFYFVFFAFTMAVFFFTIKPHQ